MIVSRQVIWIVASALVCIAPKAFSEEPVQSGALRTTFPASNNQIIKLTDSGIVPQKLTMRVDDSIVFLLNDSADSLTTLEIDFGGKQMHCNGSNVRAQDDGKVRSVRPFGPRDFASTCFHDRGTYSFTVYGLKPNPSGLTGTIYVE